MAIDSTAKRVSVVGIGRPWLRATWPDATKGAAWRAAVGHVYAGNTFAADTVAPILSLITAVATSYSAMAGTVVSDEDGPLFYLVSENQVELEATIRAADQQAVVIPGVQNIVKTGLSENTQYFLHCIQDDPLGNTSNLLVSEWFRTPDEHWSKADEDSLLWTKEDGIADPWSKESLTTKLWSKESGI